DLKVLVALNARIRVQDVEAAVGCLGQRDHRFHISGLADVTPEAGRRAADLGDLPRGLFQSPGHHVVDDDRRASGCEADGRTPAKSGPGSRDQRDLSVESAHDLLPHAFNAPSVTPRSNWRWRARYMAKIGSDAMIEAAAMRW